MDDNAQEQEMEMDALRAIYEDSLLDLGNGSFQLSIVPALDEPLHLVCFCGTEVPSPPQPLFTRHSESNSVREAV